MSRAAALAGAGKRVDPAPRHLLHVFSTFAVGGPQVRFIDTVAALGGRYRHSLIAMDGRFDALAKLPAEIDIARPSVAVGKRQTLANLRRFRRALRAIAPDQLVTYNFGAIEWALANRLGPGIPHLHVEDGFGPDEAERQLPRRVWLRRIALRGSELAVPSRLLHSIAGTVWRLPDRRVHWVPNGIDVARYAGPPDPARRAELAGDSALPIVGTLATLRAEKNIPRLIRVFGRVRESGRPACLAIVGDGPARAEAEAAAAASPFRDAIRFLGHRDDPWTLLPAFDLFALTSDTEQMPLSVLEAMASGLAIVGLDVGDVATMVAEQNRPYIVPAGDEDACVAAMLALLDDHQAARRAAAANRRHVGAIYERETMFQRYDELFQL